MICPTYTSLLSSSPVSRQSEANMSAIQTAGPAKATAGSSSAGRFTTLTCSRCSKRFRTLYLLERHQRIGRERGGICPCSKKGRGRFAVPRRLPPEGIKCPVCNEVFNNVESLYAHTKSRNKRGTCPVPRKLTGLALFKCSACDKTFSKKCHFTRHDKARLDRGGVCPKSRKCTNQQSAMPRPVEHGSPPQEENQTEEQQDLQNQTADYRDSNQLSVVPAPPTTPQTPNRTFRCPICSRTFETAVGLHKHNQKRAERGSCPLPRGTWLRGVYEDLPSVVAAPPQGRPTDAIPLTPIVCEVCGLTFRSYGGLYKHERKRVERGVCGGGRGERLREA